MSTIFATPTKDFEYLFKLGTKNEQMVPSKYAANVIRQRFERAAQGTTQETTLSSFLKFVISRMELVTLLKKPDYQGMSYISWLQKHRYPIFRITEAGLEDLQKFKKDHFRITEARLEDLQKFKKDPSFLLPTEDTSQPENTSQLKVDPTCTTVFSPAAKILLLL